MNVPILERHIEITPGLVGGRPRIAGRRITVQNIAIWHEYMGLGPTKSRPNMNCRWQTCMPHWPTTSTIAKTLNGRLPKMKPSSKRCARRLHRAYKRN